MQCPSCNRENPEDAAFCNGCGSPLELLCGECGRANPASSGFCNGCGSALFGGVTPDRTPTPEPAPTLPSSLAGGRYDVKRFLGEGGRKRVYLAHDDRLDRDVAVAIIKTEGLDEAGLSRVKREAQSMGRLGDHPNIVTIHDIGEDGEQPYIVSQYMSGGDLDGLLQRSEGRQLDVSAVLRVGSQICGALDHAHARGVIHRDLKPGNVWLTEEGDAKLGDFGLAVALDRSRVTMEGMMVGTVAYMPPEQALGRQADARSDLYSLGCVLYECLTGRPPFAGDDPTAIISQHINTTPVAPSWHTEHCPPDLEEIVLSLLAKDPDERPASAAEVTVALGQIDPEQKSATHSDSNVLDRLARGVFVGREQELERLRKAADASFAGRGEIVMLVGEPGIGKTRTTQEVETYARMRGATVLWGMGHESSGAPSYWPWMQVGRSYGQAYDLADLVPDMDGKGPELIRIFPELRQLLDAEEPEATGDPEAAQFRLFDAYTTFVRAMAKRMPLIIVLDDLHWADKPSLSLLRHLARELSRMRVLIVGTFRDTELARTHPLSEALAELNRESGFQRVVLRGLSREEVEGYIRSAANVEPQTRLVDRIFEETEGNPFFLSEVVNLLTQEGAFSKESVSDIAVPDGVREALGRRLDMLSEDANAMLGVAAVAGREFTYETLSLLGDDDEETLLRLIEEALEARVIEEMPQPGRYRFTHALMQETLLSELSTTRRVKIHGQVGQALERRWGELADQRATRLARHFVEAAILSPEMAERAMHYSRLAAQQAESQYGWAEAARHWETVLELTEERGESGEELAQILEHLGDITYMSSVDNEKGIAFLERALAIYEGKGARGKVAAMHSRLGRAMVSMLGQVNLEEGPAHLEAARAMLEEDAPDSPGLAYVYVGLATACTFELQVEMGLDYSRRALTIGETINSKPAIALGRIFVGWFLWASGKIGEGIEMMESGYRVADEADLTFVAFLGAWWRCLADLYARSDPQKAKGWAQRELNKPRLATAPFMRWNLSGSLGVALIAAGEMREAREIREAGNTFPPFVASFLSASGEWDEADRQALEVVEEGRRTRNRNVGVAALAGLADRALRSGDYAEAEKHLREALAIEDLSKAVSLSRMDRRVMMIQLLAKTERTDEALEQVAFCEDLFAQGDDWGGTPGRLALARGSILSAREEWADAEAAFDEARSTAQEYGVPWDEADALHERARLHMDRAEEGDSEEALRHLDETIAIYDRLGAKKHLELALADKLEVQGIDSSQALTSIDAVASTVYTEKPDLRQHASPDGTVTILFSDIEGSTAKTEELGDQRWMEVLREHNAIVREQLAAHDGFEVKSEGDGFMLAFQSARKALQCAVETQKAFAKRAESSDQPINVRMGLHTGEVIKEGDDFFGKHVNLAARIAGQAAGGEILVSSLLKELTASGGDIKFSVGRALELKGLSGPYEVYGVEW